MESRAPYSTALFGCDGLLLFLRLEVVGEYRQQGNADSRANHAERQLLNAVGVVEPGDGSGSDQRNNNGVNHHVNLIDAGSENAGSNTLNRVLISALCSRRRNVELRFDADVNPPEKKVQPENFKQTGNGYAPGNAVAGVSPKGTKAKTATIIVRLRITGAAAGPANLPKEFKMPD